MKVLSVYEHISFSRAVAAIAAALTIAIVSTVYLSFSLTKQVTPTVDSFFTSILGENPQFAAEGSITLNEKTPLKHSLQLKAGVPITLGEDASLSFATRKGGVIRTFENTHFAIKSHTRNEFAVESTNDTGTFWITNMVSQQPMHVVHDQINLQTRGGSALFKHEKDAAIVYAMNGLVIVELLREPGVTNADNVMQHIVIPPGYQLSIEKKRITPLVDKLYYAKVIKEFPLTLTPESITKGSFFTENLKKDDALRRSYEQAFALHSTMIAQQSAFMYKHGFSYDIIQMASLLESAHDIHASARFEYLISLLIDQYLTKKDFLVVETEAALIDHIQKQIAEDVSGKATRSMKRTIQVYFEVLSSLSERPAFKKAKASLRSILERTGLKHDQSMLRTVTYDVLDIYDVFATSEQQAKKDLIELRKKVKVLSGWSRDALQKNRQHVRDMYHVMQTLIFARPALYTTDFVRILDSMQSLVLSIEEGTQLYQEELQQAIQSNLKLLQRIIFYVKRNEFASERITMLDLADYALAANTTLKIDTVKDSAVHDFFTRQRDRIIREIAFLKSSAFDVFVQLPYSDQRYEAAITAFEKEQEALKQASTILFSDTPSHASIKPADAEEKARNELISVGISFKSLSADDDRPWIVSIIDGNSNSSQFSGDFDTTTNLISNIATKEGTIASGISIETLGAALDALKKQKNTIKKSSQQNDQSSTTETGTDILVQVLRGVVAQQLQQAGFTLKTEDVFGGLKKDDGTTSTDEFVVIGAKYGDNEFSLVFNYVISKKLIIKAKIDGQAVDGAFTTDEFKQLIDSRIENE